MASSAPALPLFVQQLYRLLRFGIMILGADAVFFGGRRLGIIRPTETVNADADADGLSLSKKQVS